MSSDEETGYGSIEVTPTKVESPTSRRRGVAVVAALALFGLVVIGGSAQGMRMAFWDDHLCLKRTDDYADDLNHVYKNVFEGEYFEGPCADDDDDDDAAAPPTPFNDDFTPDDDDPVRPDDDASG